MFQLRLQQEILFDFPYIFAISQDIVEERIYYYKNLLYNNFHKF